jgi:hypothetical protein
MMAQSIMVGTHGKGGCSLHGERERERETDRYRDRER